MVAIKNEKASSKKLKWAKLAFSISKRPLLTLIIIYIIYLSGIYLSNLFFPGFKVEIKAILHVLLKIIIPICIYWAFLRTIDYIQFQMQVYLKHTDYKNSFVVLSFFMNALKIIILLSLFSFIINLLPFSEQYTYFSEKLISIFLIAAITSILIRAVKLTENLIAIKYNIYTREDLLAQKARTQLLIIGRIAITIIVIIAVGATLILFESVRNLGASILTSAGILSLIAGLAIQRPLRNLVDSLQIIFNQLIKINDVIIIEKVEKEPGTIEEINLYYVVIKTWDRRRLVIPTSYFIENPFINLSRTSTEILGVIKIYVDYTLPIDEIRAAVKRIADDSPFWDKEICKLQVSDVKEFSIELRIDVSAQTMGDSWSLQCEIREKLIWLIQKNYPSSLPAARITLMPDKT